MTLKGKEVRTAGAPQQPQRLLPDWLSPASPLGQAEAAPDPEQGGRGEGHARGQGGAWAQEFGLRGNSPEETGNREIPD